MKTIQPVLFTLPVNERLDLPPRAETLARIESGELEHLDFRACTFRAGQNRNFLTFRSGDLEPFAESFEGRPFLRNHETGDIAARDGTILESRCEAGAFLQTIRLTTRRGMTDFVEGRIDRFSIGWHAREMLCSVCGRDYFTCGHFAGNEYQTPQGRAACEIVCVEPVGLETSAVNAPAVEGTRILSRLNALKAKFSEPEDQKGDVSMNEENVREGQEALESLCGSLLSASLNESRLPAASQAVIRRQFEGRVFQPGELQAAIEEKREELAGLSSAGAVSGPRRAASGMFSTEDQVIAAVDDLLGAPRDADKKGLKVAPLSGIREAYLLLTGDRDFTGGYFPEFALGTTATFPVVVKNALNKRLAEAWSKYGAAGYDWWRKIVTVEHFSMLDQIDWMILGTIGSLPSIEEGAEYTELKIADNGETSDWTKYGGYVGLTLEAILRDNVRAFKRLPDEVAMGGLRNISEQVAAIFTVNSGAGPVLSDTGNLFNATAVTTKGGHANLLTTALGTDLTAWRAVESAMFKLPMHVANEAGSYGTGKRQAVKPKYCLVPQDLKGAADDLFLKTWTSNGENLGYGYVEPIAVPEWTDITDWAAAADPNILPGIMLGEIFGLQPQIFLAGSETDPAMFANDESRLKVRQFLTVGIGNWRALHKSNVAG